MAQEPPFALTEYLHRVDKVRAIMEERGLDVLLLVNPVSTNYLTGYQTYSVASYQCLVVPLDGVLSILVWELELPGVFLSSWIENGACYRTGEDKFHAVHIGRWLRHRQGRAPHQVAPGNCLHAGGRQDDRGRNARGD
jgi:Xaa-Pro aminopeptidase